MTRPASVSLNGLTVEFKGERVIDGLDLEIAASEFLVLLGPSGCGKSTLMNAIAGLVDVASGEIRIGGRDVTGIEPRDRGLAMVFQSYALYPHMNVRRNLAFALTVAGLPKDEIEHRVTAAARMLRLEALLDRKPSELSGGQRQRVAIGRALVRQVGVCLFDEPLSNLDAQLRTELRMEIKRLHRQLAATMIYVTHDQVEALTLADRIAVMKDQKIQQLGTPEEIYHQPANRFVASFLGSPAMTFIEGEIVASAGSPTFRAHGFESTLLHYPFRSEDVPYGAATLGVRAEHIALAANGGFKAQVEVVEAMGAQSVVWCRGRDALLPVLIQGDTKLAPTEQVELHFDPARLHLFADGTGERL